jgi:hypothetical protein
MALCTAKIVPESCRTSAHEKTRYARSIPGRGGGEREVSAHKRRFGRGLSAGEKKDENLHVKLQKRGIKRKDPAHAATPGLRGSHAERVPVSQGSPARKGEQSLRESMQTHPKEALLPQVGKSVKDTQYSCKQKAFTGR